MRTLWQSVLGEIQLSVSETTFKTWFAPTELLEAGDEEIIIAVPNTFFIRQFEIKFNDQVRQVLAKNGLVAKRIKYTVNKTAKKPVISRETTRHQPSVATRAQQLVASMPAANPIATAATKPAATLNPRYTFDSFVVGGSNDLAYAACQNVAEKPGEKYNPLFLYGGVGLGKTHLMQAIGNKFLQGNPTAKVLYVTIETFYKDYLENVRNKKQGYADKYRNVDILIVDDMQFIAGKEKTQEEFFHTFNHLHQNNKQIIISSDRPPKSIPTLADRLKSRFEMGMSIDIQMPDFETRCNIIEAKALLSDVQLDRATIEFLAQSIKTNVRELEGALNQLLAYAEMRGVAPDLQIAEGLVSNTRTSRPQRVTAKQIVDKTARYFDLTATEICSPKRNKHIALPRQIAMYLIRTELHLSYPAIASHLGRKDHTTAIHSIDKIEKSIKLDITVREQINDIKDRLYA